MKNIYLLLISLLFAVEPVLSQKQEKEKIMNDLNLAGSKAFKHEQFELGRKGIIYISDNKSEKYEYNIKDVSFFYSHFGGLENVIWYYKQNAKPSFNNSNKKIMSCIMYRSKKDALECINALNNLQAFYNEDIDVQCDIKSGKTYSYQVINDESRSFIDDFGYLTFSENGNQMTISSLVHEKEKIYSGIVNSDTLFMQLKNEKVYWKAYNSYDNFIDGIVETKGKMLWNNFSINTKLNVPYSKSIIPGKQYEWTWSKKRNKEFDKGWLTFSKLDSNEKMEVIIFSTNENKKIKAECIFKDNKFIIYDHVNKYTWGGFAILDKTITGWVAKKGEKKGCCEFKIEL